MVNAVKTDGKTENDFTLESHYGCHRYGALVALAIICLLILGCVPVFLATKRSSIIFSVILFTTILIGVLIYFYCEWQRRQAQHMHAMSEVAIERVYVTVDKSQKPHVENMKAIKTPIELTQLDFTENDDQSTVSYNSTWTQSNWIKTDTHINGRMPKYTIV